MKTNLSTHTRDRCYCLFGFHSRALPGRCVAIIAALLLLSGLCMDSSAATNLSAGAQSSTATTNNIAHKHINWGVETWDLGRHVYSIQFKETKPVRIRTINGYLTSGPQPEHLVRDTLIRQTLVTVNDSKRNTSDNDTIAIIGSPTNTVKFNHSLDRTLLCLNVKQTGGDTQILPIDVTFDDETIMITEQKLTLTIFNESYRFSKEKGCFVSKDCRDALNVELHLLIQYDVEL